MKESKIINYIEINGQDVRMDSLPEKERLEIRERLAATFARAAGYRIEKSDSETA